MKYSVIIKETETSEGQVREHTVYDQEVENLDVQAVIAVVNGLQKKPAEKQPDQK